MQKMGFPKSPSSDGSLEIDFAPLSPEVIIAYNEATKSGKQTPLIKEEIRTKILMKRMREGKVEVPVIETKKPRRNEQLSEDDLEKRKTRRERNKVAATKCRMKKRSAAEQLEHQTDKLNAANTKLENEVENLNKEKEQLADLLKCHELWCPKKTQFNIPGTIPVKRPRLTCCTDRTVSECSDVLSSADSAISCHTYSDDNGSISTNEACEGSVSVGTDNEYSTEEVDWDFLLESLGSASQFRSLSESTCLTVDTGIDITEEEVVETVIQL